MQNDIKTWNTLLKLISLFEKFNYNIKILKELEKKKMNLHHNDINTFEIEITNRTDTLTENLDLIREQIIHIFNIYNINILLDFENDVVNKCIKNYMYQK